MKKHTDVVEYSGGSRGHVLLVSPLTFSYHESIAETLLSQGYSVTWWNDRASCSTWYKIALRLFPSITSKFSEGVFLRRLLKLNGADITHVLVIKGEGVSSRVISAVRRKARSASMGFYLWDGVGNVTQALRGVAHFDSVSTFDPDDAKEFGWHYRPLFWRRISMPKDLVVEPEYDWCFIGTIHSDRHKVINRLRERYKRVLVGYVYCYFQSPFILWLRKLFDSTIRSAPKASLSTVAMDPVDVANIVARSRAVLDVEHPRQNGFTMRTIETLLSGKKLITTNRSILLSNLYHPSRVCLIDRGNPEIPIQFLEDPFVAVEGDLVDYYSCNGWVAELLKLQDESRKFPENNTAGDLI